MTAAEYRIERERRGTQQAVAARLSVKTQMNNQNTNDNAAREAGQIETLTAAQAARCAELESVAAISQLTLDENQELNRLAGIRDGFYAAHGMTVDEYEAQFEPRRNPGCNKLRSYIATNDDK